MWILKGKLKTESKRETVHRAGYVDTNLSKEWVKKYYLGEWRKWGWMEDPENYHEEDGQREKKTLWNEESTTDSSTSSRKTNGRIAQDGEVLLTSWTSNTLEWDPDISMMKIFTTQYCLTQVPNFTHNR